MTWWLRIVSATALSVTPMFRFDKQEAVDVFERIDDVVMGGVSSSSIRGDADRAVWSGIVRTEGGGFCGTRTKSFAAPLDLSAWDGLYLDAGLASDDDAQRRAWKITLRCSKDRGEQVYSADWQPALGRGRTVVPFEDFRLVRGPRLVPDAPPLTSRDCQNVYGIGMTCSKFRAGFNTTLVENFRDGFFRVDLFEWGGYAEAPIEPAALPSVVDSRPNSGNPVFALLRPLASLVFDEKARRRARARALLLERNKVKSDFGARLYGQRVIKRGVKNLSLSAAVTSGLSEATRDGIVGALRPFARLIFRTLNRLIRWRNSLRKPVTTIRAG